LTQEQTVEFSTRIYEWNFYGLLALNPKTAIDFINTFIFSIVAEQRKKPYWLAADLKEVLKIQECQLKIHEIAMLAEPIEGFADRVDEIRENYSGLTYEEVLQKIIGGKGKTFIEFMDEDHEDDWNYSANEALAVVQVVPIWFHRLTIEFKTGNYNKAAYNSWALKAGCADVDSDQFDQGIEITPFELSQMTTKNTQIQDSIREKRLKNFGHKKKVRGDRNKNISSSIVQVEKDPEMIWRLKQMYKDNEERLAELENLSTTKTVKKTDNKKTEAKKTTAQKGKVTKK
jgi:hypothetical protein